MFAQVNGVRLAYDEAGQGPALLAFHGGPGMSDRTNNWATFSVLADRLRVVAFDLRGCGESESAEPYSHAQWVADAEALRQTLDLGPIVVTGGSYGGHLALEYTLSHPENVRALVLRDTAASNRYQAMATATALRRAPDISRDDLERLFSGRVESDDDFRRCYAQIQPLYRAVRDEAAEAAELDRIPFRYATHNWAFGRNQPAFNLVDRLGEIRVPTLVTVGRHDWICPVEASEEIARGIPGARLVVYENSGHSPQSEEREAFMAEVRGFLDAVL